MTANLITSPVAIRIVGDVRTTDGKSLQVLATRRVSGTDVGPQLVLAERFTPSDLGAANDCPSDTTTVIKLTFSGGPTGPNGDPLDADADGTAAQAI